MQLFINNWQTPLLSALSAGATVLEVASDQAARLSELGSGVFCLLTLAQVDLNGQELAWEVVKATEVSGGQITVEREQEGTTALSLAAGATVSARLTAGTLSGLLSQLPAAIQLVPAGGVPGQMLSPSSGGGRTWVAPPSGGGGSFLTRENYVEQVSNGALGISAPVAIFAADGLGAFIRSSFSSALQAALAWVTSTITTGSVVVGGVMIIAGNSLSGVVRGANGVALSTGDSSGGSVTLQAGASARFGASEVQDGSYVSARVIPTALSGGAQQYSLGINLALAPYDVIGFRCGVDNSDGFWTVYWMDSDGVEHSFLTAVAVSTSTFSMLRIEVSGSNMLCKIGATTVQTIPLAALAANEVDPMQFGVTIDLYKVSGSTPTLVVFGDPAGQITLAPN